MCSNGSLRKKRFQGTEAIPCHHLRWPHCSTSYACPLCFRLWHSCVSAMPSYGASLRNVFDLLHVAAYSYRETNSCSHCAPPQHEHPAHLDRLELWSASEVCTIRAKADICTRCCTSTVVNALRLSASKNGAVTHNLVSK